MSIFFGIALLVIAVVLIMFIYVINTHEDSNACSYAFIGIITTMCIIGAMYLLCTEFNPPITPMDVYQGKTTLDIIYRDCVPMDSVVVFKD